MILSSNIICLDTDNERLMLTKVCRKPKGGFFRGQV